MDRLHLGEPCAKPVEFREDGAQFFLVLGDDFQAGVAGIGFFLAHIKREDLEIPPHVHDPVEELGHDA